MNNIDKQVNKLFTRLLTNKTQRTYWDNISALRKIVTEEVFDRAFQLANSTIEKEKIIGIDVLVQLGHTPRFRQKETLVLCFKLLEQKQPSEVLSSILYGIGHNNENITKHQADKLCIFKDHPTSEVREGLVFALLKIEYYTPINTLIFLSKDKIADIRNWATFGLGTQIEKSNKKIINALWERVDDTDEETKMEAIVGLAKRNENVKNVIIKELTQQDEFGSLLFEAIEIVNDIDFLPYLEKILQETKNDESINPYWIKSLKDTIQSLQI